MESSDKESRPEHEDMYLYESLSNNNSKLNYENLPPNESNNNNNLNHINSKTSIVNNSKDSKCQSGNNSNDKLVDCYQDLIDCDLEKNSSQYQLPNYGKKNELNDNEVEPLINTNLENVNETENNKYKSIIKSPSNNSFNQKRQVASTAIASKLRKLDSTDSNDDIVQFEKPHVQFQKSFKENLNQSDGLLNGNLNYLSNNQNQSDSISSVSKEGNSDSSSSSDDSIDGIEDFRKQPPDGGYGWVVVAASFMINLIADGITFSFGMFYVEFLDYFGDSKGKTAWIGSIFMASPLLSGPIASFLTDRYGCRKVTIFGSILSAIGFVLSAMSNSIEMLFINFGLIAGFGLSLCYVAAVVIVAYYFDSKRSFATGISVCGSGIGTFIFAPLIQWLISEYGWRGATLILAGIFLNMCVCGCLMKDLEWTSKEAREARIREKKKKSIDSFSNSNSTNTAPGISANITSIGNGNESHIASSASDEIEDPRIFSSLINLPTFVKHGEKIPIEVLELLSKNRNINEILLQNYPHLLHSRSFSDPLSSEPGSQCESKTALSPTTIDNTLDSNNKKHRHTIQLGDSEPSPYVSRRTHSHRVRGHHHHSHRITAETAAFLKDLKMHRHSLTYRGAMLNINRYRLRASSCPDIYRNSMTTIAKEKSAWSETLSEFKKLVIDILDFSYFADIRFLLFSLSNLILYTWYDLVYVYLPDYAIEVVQIDETNASMLISLIGIINMFGEIILGWAGDRPNLNPTFIYSICMAVCGLSVVVIPFFNNYQSLCILSSFFGFTIAANYSLTSIILVELITIDRFTNAYGLLLLVQGVANLVGPPIAGILFDITGSYNLSFYLAGVFIVLSGLLLLILPAIQKIKKIQMKIKNLNSMNTGDDTIYANVKETISVNGKIVNDGSHRRNDCADV